MPASLLLSFGILILGGVILALIFAKSKKESDPAKIKQNELFPVQSIENGIITTPYGLVRFLKVIPMNYFLLSDEEKEVFERSLMDLLRAVDFPVQFFSYMKAINMRENVMELKSLAREMDSEIKRNYAENLAATLQGIFKTRVYKTSDSYLVILADDRETLESRMILVGSLFDRARITLKPATSEELTDILHEIFNRNSIFRPSIATEHGVLEDLVIGKGLVIDG